MPMRCLPLSAVRCVQRQNRAAPHAGRGVTSPLATQRRVPQQALGPVHPPLGQVAERRLARLVISDAHTGLKQAIAAVLLGASWQRSSVNMIAGGMVPLVHLRRRERTLAA